MSHLDVRTCRPPKNFHTASLHLKFAEHESTISSWQRLRL